VYKPKKGKFIYNLRTVLKVRKIREKLEKEKFAEAQKKFKEESEKEEEVKGEQKIRQDDQKNALSGKISNFNKILLGHFHLGKVKEDVDKQVKVRLEAEQKKEEQREKLIKSMMDKKIMDKDKDRKREVWRKYMNKEETKFLDDIATSRYVANKIEQKRNNS
jgi:flagellar protein FliJ